MVTTAHIRHAATFVAAVFFIAGAFACRQSTSASHMENHDQAATADSSTAQQGSTIDTATFGAGCFWCVEAIFQRLNGVMSVKSGYAGGFVKNPSYKEVCSGTTGHAEVIQLTYDKSKISYDELLEVFWKTHDPTTMNRQGADVGTQYRSVIFYHNDTQKQLAESYKKKLNEEKVYPSPVITAIEPFRNYFAAENYHQDYYNQNGNEGYCRYVIQPKLEKFERVFAKKLKH